MAYGETQLQSWDVQYKATLFHPGGGYIQVTASATEPEREADNDVAMQALIDVALANGFALDGLAWKTCQAAQTITPTPPE